jgi:hypothetical protein
MVDISDLPVPPAQAGSVTVTGAPPSPEQQTAPTAMEQSFGLGSPIARTLKGAVVNPLLAINQKGGAAIGAIGRGIESLTGPNAITQGMQEVGTGSNQVVQTYDKATQEARKRVGSEGFDWLEFGGSVVSPANRILPGGPVAQATAGSLLNPIVGENLKPSDIAAQTGWQGIFGAGVGKTFEAALPVFKEGARKLLDAGVELEPGQAFKGAAGTLMRSTESFRESIANLVGRGTPADKLNKAFTYASVNEALSPIGKTVVKSNGDGFDLVKQGVDYARAAYGDAFKTVGNVVADDTFLTIVRNTMAEAKDSLDPSDYKKLATGIKRNIVDRFTPIQTVASKEVGQEPGVLAQAFETDGQRLHAVKRYLNARLENLSGATDEAEVAKKTIIQNLMDGFKEFTYRVDETGAIKAADKTYTDMFRVAAAAKSASSKGGSFNPEQLLAAATNQSGTFAGGSGKAPMQEYAREALKVIGKEEQGLLGTRFTPSDLKNAGVVSGLGYTGLFNLPVVGTAAALGTTADLLGKIALKNPAKYEAVRGALLQQSGVLGQAAGNAREQNYKVTPIKTQGQDSLPVPPPNYQAPTTQSFNWTGGKLSATYPAVASLKVGSAGQFNPEHPIAQKVMQEAERQGLGDFKELLVRQAFQESKFNPNAKSSANARGVMQIVPGTARDLRLKDPYNPDENIRAGVEYMGQLLKRYDYDVKKALAAYNGGMRRIDKTGLTTLKPETRTYLKNILGE